MVEWFQLQDDTIVVREKMFFQFATHAKRLVEDQRKALRTGSKKKIEECKVRERALLDYVSRYESYRVQMLKAVAPVSPQEGGEQ